MNSKSKAFQIAATAVIALALAMVAYYWISWRNRKTEYDVNLQEQVQEKLKDKFSGTYSAGEPLEGEGYRVSFFTLNLKDEGGYSGSIKLDPIAQVQGNSVYMSCRDFKVSEKELFLKCFDPGLGQASFSGEWVPGAAPPQVNGKLLWSKDGNVILEKAVGFSLLGD